MIKCVAATIASRANRLDIVAVGVEQKRSEVGRAVILACSGAASVAAAGLEALAVEVFHGVVVLGAESDMDAVGLAALVEMQPERRRALGPEAGIAVAARAQAVAERGQHGGVEAHAGVEVGNA